MGRPAYRRQPPTEADRHREEMEKLFNSPEYRRLETQISRNNARFSELEPKVKLAALYLFKTGQADFMADMWRLFYRRPIPKMEDFLTEKYIGHLANILYPRWRAELIEVFKPGSKIFELVFSGSIGSGKTTAALLAHLYNTAKVASLREPQLTLYSEPGKPIQLSLFSITKKKAEEAVLDPFVERMRRCPVFEEVFKEADLRDYAKSGSDKTPFLYRPSKEEIKLDRNIFIRGGSQASHALSMDLFGAMLDEAEFRSGGLDKAFEVYNQLKQRVQSRFLGARWTMLTLVSSAKEDEGLIPNYTRTIHADDPYTRVYELAVWDVKHLPEYRGFPKTDYFYVLVGTTVHPHRILNDEEFESQEKGKFRPPPQCRVIKAPTAVRRDFEQNIILALRDLAGIRAVGAEKPFDDTSQIEVSFLPSEFELRASISDKVPLIEKLPRTLFTRTPAGLQLARYPNAPRYGHVDLAENADSQAGIGIVHKELAVVGGQRVIKIVADVLAFVTTHDRIDIDKIEQLFIDLSRDAGVQFATLSADQYQSSQMRQTWERENIATKVLLTSVVTTPEPYRQFSKFVINGNWHAGACPVLQDQLRNIRIAKANPTQKHAKPFVKAGRMDLADGACGATINALLNVEDEPIYAFRGPGDPKPATPPSVGQSMENTDKKRWKKVT